jgi:hypothetical protein
MLLDISPIESVHVFERVFSKKFANHRVPYAEIAGDSAVIPGLHSCRVYRLHFLGAWAITIIYREEVGLVTHRSHCGNEVVQDGSGAAVTMFRAQALQDLYSGVRGTIKGCRGRRPRADGFARSSDRSTATHLGE